MYSNFPFEVLRYFFNSTLRFSNCRRMSELRSAKIGEKYSFAVTLSGKLFMIFSVLAVKVNIFSFVASYCRVSAKLLAARFIPKNANKRATQAAMVWVLLVVLSHPDVPAVL